MSEKENFGALNGHYTESLDEFTNNKTPIREDNIDFMTQEDKKKILKDIQSDPTSQNCN